MHRTALLTTLLALGACNQEILLQELPQGVDGPTAEGSDDTVLDGSAETEDTEPEPSEPEEEPTEPEPEPEPAPADDCENTSDLIYVIDRADEAIYTFDPITTDFSFVGTLSCGQWEGTPGSMAVGRDGTAWVRYSSNTLFSVDLTTMACTPTTYASGFGSYGMGYATQDAQTWRDDLYIANRNTLARVDTSSGALENLGALPSQSELTGNAAGELWAFLPLEVPARLVHIDKRTAATVGGYSLPAFTTAELDTFAFATWGSDFYLFMRFYGMGNTTDVYRVDANGNMTLVAGDTGMDVVGAGVSTCAPTE